MSEFPLIPTHTQENWQTLRLCRHRTWLSESVKFASCPVFDRHSFYPTRNREIYLWQREHQCLSLSRPVGNIEALGLIPQIFHASEASQVSIPPRPINRQLRLLGEGPLRLQVWCLAVGAAQIVFLILCSHGRTVYRTVRPCEQGIKSPRRDCIHISAKIIYKSVLGRVKILGVWF